MNKSDQFIYTTLLIIAWLIFVGLSIDAGGIIVNFIIALCKPEWLPRLYQKLDLTTLYHQNISVFLLVYSFILSIAILKAVLFYWVIRLTYQLDLKNPFTALASKIIVQISYFTFFIGMLSVLAKQYLKKLQAYGFSISNMQEFWVDSEAFILMAAVLYIIAKIFKKGVALQAENDLTI